MAFEHWTRRPMESDFLLLTSEGEFMAFADMQRLFLDQKLSVEQQPEQYLAATGAIASLINTFALGKETRADNGETQPLVVPIQTLFDLELIPDMGEIVRPETIHEDLVSVQFGQRDGRYEL